MPMNRRVWRLLLGARAGGPRGGSPAASAHAPHDRTPASVLLMRSVWVGPCLAKQRGAATDVSGPCQTGITGELQSQRQTDREPNNKTKTAQRACSLKPGGEGDAQKRKKAVLKGDATCTEGDG